MAHYNSAIRNVYNYYQIQYAPKNASRYDAHKRNDLKGVYHSIIKIEKESPTYLLPKPEEIEEYSIRMKENAMQFCNTVASLGDPEDESFLGQLSAYSSNPEKVIVNTLPGVTLTNSDENSPIQLSIESLASGQQNAGYYLPAGDNALPNGTYSFDLVVASSNYELQFSISELDTNWDIQSRLSRLINNSNLGISSNVLSNSAGETALFLTSNSTGSTEDGRSFFSVSDENTSQKKGIIDYLGIRNITSPSTDAAYTINGESMHSATNTISINDQYEATLLNTTSGEIIQIGTKPDYESLKENIVSLTNSYNIFLSAATSYQNRQPRTNLLVGSMKQISSLYSKSLEDLGIKNQEDGNLFIEPTQLESALSSNSSTNSIKKLRSFTRAALHKITQVRLNPMDYVDKRMVSYKNPLKTHYANPYVTSAYSGMLFNSYM